MPPNLTATPKGRCILNKVSGHVLTFDCLQNPRIVQVWVRLVSVIKASELAPFHGPVCV